MTSMDNGLAAMAQPKSQSSPTTPPSTSNNNDLPTPPTSHNEFRAPLATAARLGLDDTTDLPADTSPTTTPSERMGSSRRAAARLSGSSSSLANAEHESPTRLAYRHRHTRSRSNSSERSRTPSPILGPAFADHPSAFNLHAGHLSVPMLGVGIGPTEQEIQLLVYGEGAAQPASEEEAESVDQMLQSLASMGLDPPSEDNTSQRERQLANMVKMLATRSRRLAESRDHMAAQLHSTRTTALSIISALKTAHAHAQTSQNGLHDRLDAEVNGWKAQAKMLKALLTRAEARSHVEDGHALSLADRAKSATTAATNVNGHRIASFRSDDSLRRYSLDHPPSSPLGPPPNSIESLNPSRHSHAFAPATESGTATTGLGISSPAAAALPEMDLASSPVSSLVSQRNKLLTDKKYLKTRVRDAEAQVLRLESELKSLRPYLVSSGVKTSDAAIAEAAAAAAAENGPSAPTTPSRSGSRKDKKKKRIITMGDAETEHLMLAARRLREMRKEQVAAAPIPSVSQHASHSLTSSPIKRQASDGPMTTGDTDYERSGEPLTPPSRSAERPPKTPKSIPNTPRTGHRARDFDDDDNRDSWTSPHERVDSASSFTGIDELLHAAESLNPVAPSPTLRTRSQMPPYCQSPALEPIYYNREPLPRPYGYPPLAIPTQRGHDLDPYGHPLHPIQSSPLRMSHESPKRRRVSSAAFEFEPYSSPFLNDRQPRFRTHTEGASPFRSGQSQERTRSHDQAPTRPFDAVPAQDAAGLSALDLLADQATASQNPSQDSDRSAGYGSPIGSLSSDEDDVAVGPSPRKNSSGQHFTSSRAGGRGISPDRNASSQSGPRAGAAATTLDSTGSNDSRGGGFGAGAFGGNQNAEKRLPYVRWTSDEDSKLRSAIKEHGQRWELISRAVGTRSYHQCRQRYLLMRRKEAAAKAQADAGDGTMPNLSASASDPQSQESDYGPDSGSGSRRKSDAQRGSRRDMRPDEPYSAHHEEHAHRGAVGRGVGSTPLHKLSIGAPAPVGSVYGQFSPDLRQGPLSSPSLASQTTPTHTRTATYPQHHHAAPSLSPSQHSMQHPSSPYSSQHTPSATRRTPIQTHAHAHYPAHGGRQLAPLQSPIMNQSGAAAGYASHPPLASSPHSHSRHFSDGSSPSMASNAHHRPIGGSLHASSPTEPVERGSSGDSRPAPPPAGGAARRMGAALYS